MKIHYNHESGEDGLAGQLTSTQLARIFSAMQFGAHAHANQRRKDAQATPYFNHCIEVAAILANEAGITDVEVLIAALLHDTVEDVGVTCA
jgi:guanosine-3',5'-bis(diphosphate) 3'-pyrophosphohydrolase